MEEKLVANLEKTRSEKKMIQTKVILGRGEEDFFLEVDFNFTDPFLKIHSVDTWVEVYDAQVIKGNKVIFNAWVNKNITYKTVVTPSDCSGIATVEGIIKHITKRIPLAGCVDINVKDCERLDPKLDIAEALEAYVIGDVEEYLGETEITYDTTPTSFVPKIYKYNKLHEKMCVKVKFKVVRWEHLNVEVEGKHC